MKLRRRRGPNWDDASVRATIVIENATPATVIMDPAIAASVARTPSGPVSRIHGRRRTQDPGTRRSSVTSTTARAPADSVMHVGQSQ